MIRLRTLIPIILIAVSLLTMFFYMKPLYVEMLKINNKKTQVEMAIQKTKEIGTVLDNLQSEINSISNVDMDKIDAILPNRIDEVRYLDMVSSLADSYNLPISDIKLSGLEDSEDTGDTALLANNTGAEEIRIVKIEFSVSSTYEEFKEFLKAIERSLVILRVDSISLGAGGSLDEDVYSYKVNLSAYLKK